MDEENNKPRAGVSRSFIFSIFIVLAIIGLIAFLIFSNTSSSNTLEPQQFVNLLVDGKVSKMQLVSAQTQVTINGKYKDLNAKGETVEKSFTPSEQETSHTFPKGTSCHLPKPASSAWYRAFTKESIPALPGTEANIIQKTKIILKNFFNIFSPFYKV